ncbi:ankyrin repeat-containing domain protein [Parachaetomium inaequale]|uniref:Ankyrin repeat-containing domain protein n=1 Tax=Parachaetomium inaequale TaxID=2588326 RepID=A0AAN6P7A3_9PEZI|nr:ankyrin repeat-containing domain protein [Parachaetomium inaequale]
MYAKIHSMMEDIQKFEHATNADMLDRIHEALMRTHSHHSQSPTLSAQVQPAHRRRSSTASSQSSGSSSNSSTTLATVGSKLPFEDTGPGALVWAISKRQPKDVKMILEFMQVDPNFPIPGDDNKHNEIPLHLAASLGEAAIVTTLLDHGADPSAHDARVWTVLRAACRDGHADHPDTVRSLLLPKNAGGTGDRAWPEAEMLAALLLRYGAEPAAVDGRGRQPIQCAAEAGQGGIVRLLLDTGRVAVDARDGGTGGTRSCARLGRGDAGNDAFYYAAAGGHVLVAAYLLGASVRVPRRRRPPPNVRGDEMDEGRRDDHEMDGETVCEADGGNTVEMSD